MMAMNVAVVKTGTEPRLSDIFALARLKSDGFLDAGFGNLVNGVGPDRTGVTWWDVSGSYSSISAVAVQQQTEVDQLVQRIPGDLYRHLGDDRGEGRVVVATRYHGQPPEHPPGGW